ncbi:MAG: glycosyltransferase family 39 protein, partial [Acidobacteriaceae bacterium]|nr:glycosyltransferase family 39 protein [Acidobacteriaceae bacterium]
MIFVIGLITPPHLMDDVDAAQSLQAKNMLTSGDWVTQRLDGILYLEKAPLKYWITAVLYKALGVHDWVARIPTALAAILLCWLVARIGRWAVSPQVGFYSGTVLATSIGLFLFTRTTIPDVLLTLWITLSLWCFLRAMEDAERSRRWALGAYASMAGGLLTKGLIGVFFPVAIAFVYLLATKRLFARDTWRRLSVLPGIALFLAIAAPWHILAILRNPPYFDFSLHVGPHFGGQFRGFFWFYFINEQVLRFLNERWPRDYNTVPRLWFWLYSLLWFFPWSFFLPAAAGLKYKPVDRASRLHCLALCWMAVVMVFFTFSTTQEYYSMPTYPAIALLLGSAMASGSIWLRRGVRVTASIASAAFVLIAFLLFTVRNLQTPGDIAMGLSHHPQFYTLSLGHAADLTIPALAYLRLPLALAGLAFLVGAAGCWMLKRNRAYLAIAAMLVLFFQAARLALITFDPYLSSYSIADTLRHSPKGTVILCGKYNPLSSIFFYAENRAYTLDTDLDILEYG